MARLPGNVGLTRVGGCGHIVAQSSEVDEPPEEPLGANSSPLIGVASAVVFLEQGELGRRQVRVVGSVVFAPPSAGSLSVGLLEHPEVAMIACPCERFACDGSLHRF